MISITIIFTIMIFHLSGSFKLPFSTMMKRRIPLNFFQSSSSNSIRSFTSTVRNCKTHDSSPETVRKGVNPSSKITDIDSSLLPVAMDWDGTAKDMQKLIVHEDENIVVIYKPPTMLSQQEKGSKDEHTVHMEMLLLEYLKIQQEIKRKKEQKEVKSTTTIPFVGLVHRLDRPTSGLMLFAKTLQSLQILNKSIQDKRNMRKLYLCMINGKLPMEEKGVYEDTLIATQRKTKVILPTPQTPMISEASNQTVIANTTTVMTTNEKGKGKGKEDQTKAEKNIRGMYAKLRYHVLQNIDFNIQNITKTQSLLQIELQTGRKHQIRAQLESRGLSIVGDTKYGASQHFQTRDIALHAYYLQFRHPITKTILTFATPPPRIWEKRFTKEIMNVIDTLIQNTQIQVAQNGLNSVSTSPKKKTK